MLQRFIYAVLLVNVMLTNVACATTDDRENSVAKLIDSTKNDLLLGMRSSDIEKYFRSKGIEYSYMSVEKLASQPIQLLPPETYAGLKGIYTGIIRNVKSSVSVATGILIKVEIDADDKVRAVNITEEYAGL